MLTVSRQQRQYLELDGAPLPIVDAERGQCYMLMPVEVAAGEDGTFRATVPGIEAVAEADDPGGALDTLAVLLKSMPE